jgi:hypothetical protein
MSDEASGHRASLLAVTPGIFDVLGIAMTGGRALDGRDGFNQQPVVVVSAVTAKLLFGTVDVVGRDLMVWRPRSASEKQEPLPVTRTIVGVVNDVDTGSPGRRVQGLVFVPFEQHYESRMAVVVRSATPADIAAALPEIVRRAAGGVAVTDLGTGVELSGVANIPLQVTAGLTGTLGMLALVLAMTGLYGVLSYLVSSRRRELGVRRAVGATTSQIVRLVVSDGLYPVVAGLVVGLTAAAALRISLNRIVHYVPDVEPSLVIVVPLLFIAAGALACYVPARRASLVDPSDVLRDL